MTAWTGGGLAINVGHLDDSRLVATRFQPDPIGDLCSTGISGGTRHAGGGGAHPDELAEHHLFEFHPIDRREANGLFETRTPPPAHGFFFCSI